jgi:hypothetical protein
MQETSLRKLAVILHADEWIAHERMRAVFRRLSDFITFRLHGWNLPTVIRHPEARERVTQLMLLAGIPD